MRIIITFALIGSLMGCGKPEITSDCSLNGLGEAKCTFKNSGSAKGSTCEHLVLINARDNNYSRHFGFEKSLISDNEICSGIVQEDDIRQISITMRFMGGTLNPSEICGYGSESWSKNCSFSTIKSEDITKTKREIGKANTSSSNQVQPEVYGPIAFLDGHGERSLTGEKNRDLGEFGHQLGKKGFKLSNPDLTIAQSVPRNAAILVIAAPQVDVPAHEVQKIIDYVATGGNLLWLIDQEPLHGLHPLAEYLGIQLTQGTVVDLSSSQYGADQKIAFANQYSEHPITKNFQLRALFPEARQIDVIDTAGDWKVTRLVDVAPNGWLETGDINGKVSFDDKRDIAGPINIAVAMERKVENITQRVVVVGNGNFLANTFLANGGNLDLGLNIIEWLKRNQTVSSK